MQTYMLDHVVGMHTPLDDPALRASELGDHCRCTAMGSTGIPHGKGSDDGLTICSGNEQWRRQHRSCRSREWCSVSAPISRSCSAEPFYPKAIDELESPTLAFRSSKSVQLRINPVHCAVCHSMSVTSECSGEFSLNRSQLQSYSSSDTLGCGVVSSEMCKLNGCSCNTECFSLAKDPMPFDRSLTLSNEEIPHWTSAVRLQRIINTVASVFSPALLASNSRRRRCSGQSRQTSKNTSRSGCSSWTDPYWQGSTSGRADAEEARARSIEGGDPKKSSSRLSRAFLWSAHMDIVRLRFLSRDMEDNYKHNFYSNKAHINAIEQAIIICLVSLRPACHCGIHELSLAFS